MTFIEAMSVKSACIYRFTFPDGKYYVGQTKNLSARIRLYNFQLRSNKSSLCLDALRLHGVDSVSVDILCVLSGLAGSDLLMCLSILEIKYIRELNALHPNGYNVSPGGEYLAIPPEFISTDNYRFQGSSKGILVYDADGNYLSSYPSINRCSYDMGIPEKELLRYLDRPRIFDGRYIFKFHQYDYIPEKIEPAGFKKVSKTRIVEKVEVVKRVVEKEYVTHVVPRALKYDSFGNFCGEYESKTKAVMSFSKNHHVPYGKYVRGFVIYKKVSDDYPTKIEPYEETIGKVLGDVYKPMSECEDMPVCILNPSPIKFVKKDKLRNDFPIRQYNLDGSFVAEYNGIREASHITGLSYCGIWACIMGRTRKSQGYIWRRVDSE